MKKATINFNFNVVLTYRDAQTGKINERIKAHNLVVDSGLASIIGRIVGGDSPVTKGTITYCALGTGTNAPASGDTQLQTEVFRKQVSVRSSTANVGRFRTFFNTDEANATLKEAGLFGDSASATANSGTLFCRLSIDRAKTSAETLTLDWEITAISA